MKILWRLAGHLLAAGLEKKLRAEKLDQAFACLTPLAGEARRPPKNQDKPRVAALQVEALAYKNLTHFVRDVDRYFADADAGGAHLVCFPELFGLFLLFLSPAAKCIYRFLKWKTKNAKIGAASTAAGEKTGSAKAGKPADIASLFQPLGFLEQAYFSIMARFAVRYRVYVSCGTTYVAEGGRLYNRHKLLGPGGGVLACQDKLHPVPEEIQMGLAVGERVAVAKTPIGNIALTVCMDATYFETFKIAKALGADYALVPIANIEPYNYHLALRGAQSRVSETGLAAVKSALVAGPDFPVEFTGRAGVFFPLGAGLENIENAEHSPRGMVLAEMDLPRLREFVPRDFCLKNSAFNQSYLNALLRWPRQG